MGVLTKAGKIDEIDVENRIFGSLSAKDEGDKLRLISDIFYVNAFSKPFLQQQADKLVLDDLFCFASKFKFIFSGCSIDFSKYYSIFYRII